MNDATTQGAWERAESIATQRTRQRQEQDQLAAARTWAGERAFGPADPSLAARSSPAVRPSLFKSPPEPTVQHTPVSMRQLEPRVPPRITWWLTRPLWLIGWCLVLWIVS